MQRTPAEMLARQYLNGLRADARRVQRAKPAAGDSVTGARGRGWLGGTLRRATASGLTRLRLQ